MEISDYIGILKRRKSVIIVTALVTLGLSILVQLIIPVTYISTIILRIEPYSTGEPPYAQILYADRIMNTFVEIASSSSTTELLKKRLEINIYQILSIEVDIIPKSELIRITVEDSDSQLAQDAANILAGILLEDRSIRDIRVSIIEPALLEDTPSFLKKIVYAVMTFFVGAIGGIGIAFLLDNLDPTLYTTSQIEKLTNLPILGQIPINIKVREEKAIIDSLPWKDAFLRMRTIFFSVAKVKNIKTILITSAELSEGKTIVAANFARSIAMNGNSVLLVDANLQHPSIHTVFGLDNNIGFIQYLENKNNVFKTAGPLQESLIDGIDVLTSGAENPDIENLMNLNKMPSFFRKHESNYDFIFFDTPAFFDSADTAVLSLMVDAVIIIVKSGSSTKHELDKLLQQLKQLEVIPLGIVVNQAQNSLS